MSDCLRSKLTVWKEDQFTVMPGQGIKNREARVAEWVVKALPLVKSVVCCERQFNHDHQKYEDYGR